MNKHIIYNALRTPDGTVLESHSVHDYRTHDDANGKRYMIDGGKEYVHSSAQGDEEYLTVYNDAPHEKIREVFTWGTRGKNGDQPLQWKVLRELTIDHIKAILKTQLQVPTWIQAIFINELEYRNGEQTDSGSDKK